jgi:hypothetical protein
VSRGPRPTASGRVGSRLLVCAARLRRLADREAPVDAARVAAPQGRLTGGGCHAGLAITVVPPRADRAFRAVGPKARRRGRGSALGLCGPRATACGGRGHQERGEDEGAHVDRNAQGSARVCLLRTASTRGDDGADLVVVSVSRGGSPAPRPG